MTASLTKSSTYGLETISLACGSTLYFKRMPEAPRVALGIYVDGGNRIESQPGIADMIDDLLNEGTETRSAEQIAVEMDSFSLDMDTDTRRDFSVMSATFLPEDLEESTAFLADLLYHSTLAEVEKEKVRLHGELIMDLDSPRNRSHDLLMTHLLEKTPYRASHTNILETVAGLSDPAVLKTHYKQVYQPQNVFITVVGNLDSQALVNALDTAFEKVRTDGSALIPTGVSIPPLSESRYLTAAKDDSNQMHIFKGWFAPEVSHPDYPAMVVMNTILGGAGLTSRLFLELRDKQGLAYNVRSQFESSKYMGLFSLYIGTEPSNRKKALKGFEVECQKLMDTPVSAQELTDAQENILGRRVVFLETAPQQCAYLGSQLASGLTLAEIEEMVPRIQAVTSAQVQEVSQRYLSRPSLITAVGPTPQL